MTHQGQATEQLSPDVQRMIREARAAGRAEMEAELRPVMNALKETAAKARYLFLIITCAIRNVTIRKKTSASALTDVSNNCCLLSFMIDLCQNVIMSDFTDCLLPAPRGNTRRVSMENET